MDDDRRFDDEAAAQVLKRAAELQHATHVPATAGEGLSGTELQEVAREAGIDPAFVRQAITERETGLAEPAKPGFLGEAKVLELVAETDGEVSGEALELMIEEVQRAFADAGTARTSSHTATWTASRQLASGRLSSLVVGITSRGGRTEIRITENLDNLSTALFAGLFVGGSGVGVGISGAIGMEALGSPLVWVAGALASIGGFYTLARTLYSRSARRRRWELKRLLGRLADIATEGGPPSREVESGG